MQRYRFALAAIFAVFLTVHGHPFGAHRPPRNNHGQAHSYDVKSAGGAQQKYWWQGPNSPFSPGAAQGSGVASGVHKTQHVAASHPSVHSAPSQTGGTYHSAGNTQQSASSVQPWWQQAGNPCATHEGPGCPSGFFCVNYKTCIGGVIAQGAVPSALKPSSQELEQYGRPCSSSGTDVCCQQGAQQGQASAAVASFNPGPSVPAPPQPAPPSVIVPAHSQPVAPVPQPPPAQQFPAAFPAQQFPAPPAPQQQPAVASPPQQFPAFPQQTAPVAQPGPAFAPQQQQQQSVPQRPPVSSAQAEADLLPYPGCAAALKCVKREFCDVNGVMVNEPVFLTPVQEEYRVPITPCLNVETNQVGFCCRDPLYEDPWPADMPMPGMPGGNKPVASVPVQAPAVAAPAQPVQTVACTQQQECIPRGVCLFRWQQSGASSVQNSPACRSPTDGNLGVCCNRLPPPAQQQQFNPPPPPQPAPQPLPLAPQPLPVAPQPLPPAPQPVPQPLPPAPQPLPAVPQPLPPVPQPLPPVPQPLPAVPQPLPPAPQPAPPIVEPPRPVIPSFPAQPPQLSPPSIPAPVPQPQPIPAAPVIASQPQPIGNDCGFPSSSSDFPWHGLVVSDSGTHLCSATLVGGKFAVTAANCLKGSNPTSLRLRLGQTSVGSGLTPYREEPVVAVVSHPDFQEGSLFNDIALVVLQNSVLPDANLNRICLPGTGESFPDNCYIEGWDKGAVSGSSQVPIQKVQVSVVQNKNCESLLQKTHLGKYFKLHQSFTCALGREQGQVCKVSSGSPLVCKRPGSQQAALVGISSWTATCDNQMPAVYTDSTNFASWIQTEINRPESELVSTSNNAFQAQQQFQAQFGAGAAYGRR